LRKTVPQSARNTEYSVEDHPDVSKKLKNLFNLMDPVKELLVGNDSVALLGMRFS
jgi:hypothetical protein